MQYSCSVCLCEKIYLSISNTTLSQKSVQTTPFPKRYGKESNIGIQKRTPNLYEWTRNFWNCNFYRIHLTFKGATPTLFTCLSEKYVGRPFHTDAANEGCLCNVIEDGLNTFLTKCTYLYCCYNKGHFGWGPDIFVRPDKYVWLGQTVFLFIVNERKRSTPEI